MTLDEIDHLLDFMAKEAAEKSDESYLPGVISLDSDTYYRLSPRGLPFSCTNILHGIRYRGIQTLVARGRENKVLNRADAGETGAPYFDLEPKA